MGLRHLMGGPSPRRRAPCPRARRALPRTPPPGRCALLHVVRHPEVAYRVAAHAPLAELGERLGGGAAGARPGLEVGGLLAKLLRRLGRPGGLGNLRLERLDLGVLGLELCDVVGAVAPAHLVLLGRLLALLLLRVDVLLLPALLLVLALSDLVLRLLHATGLTLHCDRLSASYRQRQCPHLLGTYGHCPGVSQEGSSDARIKGATSTTLGFCATHTSPSNTRRESSSSQRRALRVGREEAETAQRGHGRPHRHCETQ